MLCRPGRYLIVSLDGDKAIDIRQSRGATGNALASACRGPQQFAESVARAYLQVLGDDAFYVLEGLGLSAGWAFEHAAGARVSWSF